MSANHSRDSAAFMRVYTHRMTGQSPADRHPYTEVQKASAVALYAVFGTLDRAVRHYRECFPDERCPEDDAVRRWVKAGVEPDHKLVELLTSERRQHAVEQMNEIRVEVLGRFKRELLGMSWREVKDGMIALGIAHDKVAPVRQYAQQRVMSQRGKLQPWSARPLPEANVIEGEARELPSP